MLHSTPVEQPAEGEDAIDIRRLGAARGLEHRRLQIPENRSGPTLAERQEPLAGGHKARNRLMQEGQNSAVFIETKHAARKTEGRGMVHQTPGLLRGFES